MASLQNEQIDQSYQGLIKTANNQGGAPFPPARLQYGDGTELPISLADGTSIGAGQITIIEGTPGQAGGGYLEVAGPGVNIQKLTNITNGGGTAFIWDGTYNFGQGFPGAPATTVDFTNATVTGLPAGAAGLESGTGTDSMQSAASLTTNPAQANTPNSIALGNGAIASKTGIAIGNNANNNSNGGITIGNGAATGSLDEGLAIGLNADCNANAGGIAFGRDSECNGTASIAIGRNSLANNSSGIAMGWNSKMNTTGGSGVAIGFDSQVNAADAVALGVSTRGNASGAVALGKGVTAATADTVSLKRLQMLDYASLNFADDSAAATGGIPLGGVYHTSGTVKVRIA